MQEELTFKIDCEWLCNFVRQRVYWEGMDFQWGLDTLKTSFGDVLSEEDCFAILTGTKKIVGINSGELVNDDKLGNYLNYIKRDEKKRKQQQLEEHITIHPLDYVDPFATLWSYKKLKLQAQREGYLPSLHECREWFCQPPMDDDQLFDGGMYSLKLATSIVSTDDDKDKFYRQLYDYWKDELKSDIYSDKDKDRIKQRNRSYELWYEKRTGKKFSEIAELVKSSTTVAVLSDEEIEERRREKAPHWVIRDDHTYNLCEGSESHYQRQAKFVPLDEGQFHEYGIIAPSGDFYACTFASHESAAVILCCQFGYFGERPKDFKSDEEWLSECSFLYRSEAKDMLYDRGFVFVNSAYGFGGTFYSKYGELENMPQKVMNTAYDYEIWRRNLNNL